MQKPGIDGGMFLNFRNGHAAAQGITDIPEPVGIRHPQFFQQQLLFLAGQRPSGFTAEFKHPGVKTTDAYFKRPDRLLE